MSLVPTFLDEIVTITINPHGLTCALIRLHKGATPFYVSAYQHTPFNNAQYEQAIIFNPTFIKNTIAHFLTIHALHNAFITFALEGPAIVEAIIELPHASAQADDFHFPKLKKISWDYHYFYPTDNAHYAFYVCGISRHILAQHTLVALSLPGIVTHITTSTLALFNLYVYVQGAAFRRTQLQRDMELHNNSLKTFFTSDSLRRLITIHPLYTFSIDQEQHLLSCLGLFIIERNLVRGIS